jgi:hypothetical protein
MDKVSERAAAPRAYLRFWRTVTTRSHWVGSPPELYLLRLATIPPSTRQHWFPPPKQTRKSATPTGIPLDIAVAPMSTVGTPRCGAGQNYNDVMSKTSWVLNEAGPKDGIVDNLQDSVVDNRDFDGATGNICPGWDTFLATLGNSAFMVCAGDVPNSVHQVFLAQARSADWAMEEFCKEMERSQTLKERLQGDMNEMVESLWEDTNNLQDEMAKDMALACANKATTAKTLQSAMSLEATTAALMIVVNDLIPVVQCQGVLLHDMQ